MPGKPIFDVRVHAQAATGCRIGQKNMGVTCSEDGIVKVWDIFDLDEGKPRLIHAQNPKCVKILNNLGETILYLDVLIIRSNLLW
jgi:hypothetical protein